MGYRKFSAQQIFTGFRLVENLVLITDENGTVEGLIAWEDAGDDVQLLNGILTPGFINAHCHLELSHMKGVIAPGTGMVDFLLGVMGQRTVDETVILQAIADAETSMLQQGIVAVGDICNTHFTIPQKEKGRLYYQNFIEATGFVPATADARFGAAQATWEQFRAANLQTTEQLLSTTTNDTVDLENRANDAAGENLQESSPARSPLFPGRSIIGAANSSIVPHAPYSVSAALFERIAAFPGNGLLTMHNQESLEEEQFIQSGGGAFNRLYQALGLDISFYQPSGKSSLQTTLPRFRNNQQLILVHNVTTNAGDLQFLQEGRMAGVLPAVHFCLCPNANLYIGNGLPDVELLRQKGEHIVVGTDSLASNHQLSIVAELKTLHQHFPVIPLEELLRWGTSQGAAALGIDDYYGSFEANKQPGVVLLDADLSRAQRLL
ncbi:amidohydrolase family protein [Paraflavitalea sp. CAU 1676]|uniref:amidohydrolase family protein n=1 Tax=Paraflavitalea sp. CAU 1676 TaxID=3032598 RepID=UPI0023DCBF2A|nr:amidohydrolase family protein [Paraflavitalea sp. CAU 1676]MDF2187132.1 amidohydrolase family protein [Paraflavitalea sp. CAU 1676]